MSIYLPNFISNCQNFYPISDQTVKIYTQFQTKILKSIRSNFRTKCQSLYPISHQNALKHMYPLVLHAFFELMLGCTPSWFLFQGRKLSTCSLSSVLIIWTKGLLIPKRMEDWQPKRSVTSAVLWSPSLYLHETLSICSITNIVVSRLFLEVARGWE